MTGAALIKWGGQVPGREAKSLEVFGKSIERFEQLTKEGRLHAHREYIALTGQAIVTDFEITLYAGGTDKSIQDLIGTYMGAMGELGYL
jgi:hypothetical protein